MQVSTAQYACSCNGLTPSPVPAASLISSFTLHLTASPNPTNRPSHSPPPASHHLLIYPSTGISIPCICSPPHCPLYCYSTIRPVYLTVAAASSFTTPAMPVLPCFSPGCVSCGTVSVVRTDMSETIASLQLPCCTVFALRVCNAQCDGLAAELLNSHPCIVSGPNHAVQAACNLEHVCSEPASAWAHVFSISSLAACSRTAWPAGNFTRSCNRTASATP